MVKIRPERTPLPHPDGQSFSPMAVPIVQKEQIAKLAERYNVSNNRVVAGLLALLQIPQNKVLFQSILQSDVTSNPERMPPTPTYSPIMLALSQKEQITDLAHRYNVPRNKILSWLLVLLQTPKNMRIFEHMLAIERAHGDPAALAQLVSTSEQIIAEAAPPPNGIPFVPLEKVKERKTKERGPKGKRQRQHIYPTQGA